MDDSPDAICAACGETTRRARICTECGGAVRLGERYWLDAIAGQGSFGLVYAGRRVDDGAAVAIKEVVVGHGEAARARVDAEASALAARLHPGLPELLERIDIVSSGVPMAYLVMRRVDGPDLATALRERRFSVAEVFSYLGETCSILAEMHARGLVHRDIKGEHIILRPSGQLALLDLGSVAPLAEPSGAHLTATGTVGYMPSEQMAGVTRVENDVYAVGALGVAMLTRQAPIDLLDADHRLAWSHRVQLHPRQRRWLESLLSREAGDRPSDTSRLAREAHSLASLDPSTRPRSPLPAFLVAGCALALIGTTSALAWPSSPAASVHPPVAAKASEEPTTPAVAPPVPVATPAPPTACEVAGDCRSISEFEGLQLHARTPAPAGARVVEHTQRFEAEVGGVRVPCRRVTRLPLATVVTCFHGPRSGHTDTRFTTYLAYLRDAYGRESPGAYSARQTGFRWTSARYSLEVTVTRPPGCSEDDCVEDLRTHWMGPPPT